MSEDNIIVQPIIPQITVAAPGPQGPAGDRKSVV